MDRQKVESSSGVFEKTTLPNGIRVLSERFPALVAARMSPFGDDGPWASYRGSDLVHLALGGVMMNCGYDPDPDGAYDLPPIAPQMWHAYHVAGEQLSMGILAALVFRHRTGMSQQVSCAVHEAVAKCTEVDLMTTITRHVAGRIPDAALENLRDVAAKRIETGEDAEAHIVEILMRAAQDIRGS